MSEELTMIDPQNQFFLSQIGSDKPNEPEIKAQIESFAAHASEKHELDDEGLTAQMLNDYFPEFMTPEQKDRVKGIINKAQKTTKSLRRLYGARSFMDNVVTRYVKTGTTPYEFYERGDLRNPLANAILEADLKIKVRNLKSGARQKMIIQEFVGQGNRPGVWISKAGVPLDKSKV